MNHSLPEIGSCAKPFINGDHDLALSTLKRVPVASEVGSYRVSEFTLQVGNTQWSRETFRFVFSRLVPRILYDRDYVTLPKVPLLHLAAHHGWVDVLDELLHNKAYNVDPKAIASENITHETALHYAARQGHMQAVKRLNGVCQVSDPNILQAKHATPLHYACGIGKLEMVQYFIEEAKVDPESEAYMNNSDTYGSCDYFIRPLHLACLSGHIDVVKYLFPLSKNLFNTYANCASIKICKNDGFGRCSPLELACVSKSLDLVRFLVLEKGYSPAVTDIVNQYGSYDKCIRSCCQT